MPTEVIGVGGARHRRGGLAAGEVIDALTDSGYLAHRSHPPVRRAATAEVSAG